MVHCPALGGVIAVSIDISVMPIEGTSTAPGYHESPHPAIDIELDDLSDIYVSCESAAEIAAEGAERHSQLLVDHVDHHDVPFYCMLNAVRHERQKSLSQSGSRPNPCGAHSP